MASSRELAAEGARQSYAAPPHSLAAQPPEYAPTRVVRQMLHTLDAAPLASGLLAQLLELETAVPHAAVAGFLVGAHGLGSVLRHALAFGEAITEP